MKDYTLESTEKAYYILNIEKCKDGTYNVIFADGNVFKKVEANQENLNKIIQIQEEQAKGAVSKYKVFSDKVKRAKTNAFALSTSILAGSTILSFIPAINNTLMNGVDMSIRVAGIGAITLLGSIPAFSKLNREKSRLKELDKIKYRNQHMRELKSFKEYENSLSGISSDTARKIAYSQNPFSIINIDNFTKEDLEYIISNIAVEKEYQFTYKKTTKK